MKVVVGQASNAPARVALARSILVVIAIGVGACAPASTAAPPSPSGSAAAPSASHPSPSPAASAPVASMPSGSPSAAASASAAPTAGWVMALAAGDDARGCSTSCSEVELLGVVRSGGRYVAVGQGQAQEAMAWHSDDGASWTRAPDSAALDRATMTGVAGPTGGYVAVGATIPANGGVADGLAWVSPDGSSWSRVAGLAVFHRASPRAIAAFGGGLVAVGAVTPTGGSSTEPAAWWSADGRAWARAILPPGLRAGSLVAVAARSGLIVAAGAADGLPLFLASTDGRAWSRVTPRLAEADGYLPPNARLGTVMDVAAGTSGWLATGGDGQHGGWLASSKDGRAWTLYGFGPTVDGAGGYDEVAAVPGGWIGAYDSIVQPHFRAVQADPLTNALPVDIGDPSFATSPAMWSRVAVAGDLLVGMATTLGGLEIWVRPVASIAAVIGGAP